MWVGGRRVTPRFTYNNLGNKSFRLSYAVPAALAPGAHRVTVKVHDLRSFNSTYSWVFTTGETIAPVTTSNAVREYTDSATIFLFATDNAGGSGVAHTYYTLDGFPGEGPIVYTSAGGDHDLEFWSVDAAGNAEAKHVVEFTVAKDMATNAWHQKTTGFCATPGCHFASLTVEHYQHADANGALLTCFTCHDSEDADVVATIAARSDACERCHGNTTNHIGNHTTTVPPTATINCIQAGCHTGNLIALHVNAKSGTMVSCGVCHANPDHAATKDCTVCHGNSGPHAGNHIAINGVVGSWTHNLGDPSCTNGTCHGSDLMAPHINTTNPTGCGTCHSAVAGSRFSTATIAAVRAGGATCATCHNPAHVTLAGTNHNIASACNCHGDSTPDNDATAIHMNQQTTVGGVVLTGCEICHANANVPVPTLECATCHPGIGAIHSALPETVAAGKPFVYFTHADPAGTKSSACVACHGTDLPSVHIGAKACVCHTATFLASEMATLIAAGDAECVDCHTGTHAAHNFDATASGHNTTTFGVIGAKTKFDGSQGVKLTWESEASVVLTAPVAGNAGTYSIGQTGTVNSTWSFPTINVFWGSSDASAPATAIKGLTKDSIITCQDCHTGLNAAGPHGAAQNWGLDPAYPGDYSYAELTKYVTCNSQYASTDMSEPNRTKYLTPLSVSGISMRSALTSSAPLISRTDGTKGANAVICAKCHDLENVSLAADNGTAYDSVEGANTAHDSHHQDQLDGSAQCVNCHVGVPHGWRAPRLLVDTDTDAAPYLDPQHLGTTRASSTGKNTGDTRNPLTGFNGQGMQSLSGVNDHTLGGSNGTPGWQPYGTGDGKATATLNLAHTGMAYWDESQCQACGDHEGENGPGRIVYGD